MTAPGAPTRGNWFTRGGWWFFVHVLSIGVLAVVPFTHAAVVSRRVGHIVLAGVALVLTIVAFTVLGAAPEDANGKVTGPAAAVGGLVIMTLLIGGLVALIVLRAQIYGRNAPVRQAAPAGPDPAVARALAGRQRRQQARDLAANDPLLAHELRIGRPDLPRDYDDGGLVDLNGAPAPVVAQLCGIEPVQAARIVQARQAAGRFAGVEDVFAWTDLPVEVWDRVRDRGIVL